MYRKGKDNRKETSTAVFVFVPSVFWEKFPTAEFWIISIGRNFLLGSTKNSQMFNEAFYFLYAPHKHIEKKIEIFYVLITLVPTQLAMRL
jgi:hypothetical protein